MKLEVPIKRKDQAKLIRLCGDDRGYWFNLCLDEISQLDICFDEEKLAETLFNIFNLKMPKKFHAYAWINMPNEIKEEYRSEAKSIIAAMPEILTIKKGSINAKEKV